MNQAYTTQSDHSRTSGWGPRLLFALVPLALLAGGFAYWLDRSGDSIELPTFFNLRSVDDGLATEDAAGAAETTEAGADAEAGAASEATTEEARQAVERVEQVVEQQGGLDSRVAAMEQRLTRLDLQSQAAAGNAARAEGLLIAFAARRSIERGAPLGYLAEQLRLRFGDARPNAVQTIIDAAQDPVTLDQLLARLDGLANQLKQSPANEGVFEWLGREISQMFIVRREDTPSPVAERRMERARLFLQSGRTEAAVAEIRNLPNATIAADWIIDAERYAAAQRALELLETTAVLEPRDLRDADGDRVEQPSPMASDTAAL